MATMTRAGFLKRMAFAALASGLLGTELLEKIGKDAWADDGERGRWLVELQEQGPDGVIGTVLGPVEATLSGGGSTFEIRGDEPGKRFIATLSYHSPDDVPEFLRNIGAGS